MLYFLLLLFDLVAHVLSVFVQLLLQGLKLVHAGYELLVHSGDVNASVCAIVERLVVSQSFQPSTCPRGHVVPVSDLACLFAASRQAFSVLLRCASTSDTPDARAS